MKLTKARREHCRKVFRRLTWAVDLEAAIIALGDAEIRELNRYLSRKGSAGGVPKLIHGLILHEAATRLMIQSPSSK